MGKLYHGLANPHGFRRRSVRLAVFLRADRVRAYLQRMASAGRISIAVSLAAALAVLSVTGTSYAGSYGHIDAFVVRQKISKDLPKINRCYESALRYEPAGMSKACRSSRTPRATTTSSAAWPAS
jgi:hypothetical protein